MGNSKAQCHCSSIAHSKNRNVVVTKSMLFQLNVGHKDAFTTSRLQMLLTITYWFLGTIQCFREYKKFLKSNSMHFYCSFMQLKQQTSNSLLLGMLTFGKCTVQGGITLNYHKIICNAIISQERGAHVRNKLRTAMMCTCMLTASEVAY